MNQHHKPHGRCCVYHGSRPEGSRTEKGITEDSTRQPHDLCPCPEKQPFVATLTAADRLTEVHEANLFIGTDCLAVGDERCTPSPIDQSRAEMLLGLPVSRYGLQFLPILRC